MAIDLPARPAPLQTAIRRLDFDVSQTPPLGGVARNYGRLGTRHSADIAMGALDGACAGRWIGARGKARATGATVRMAVQQPEGLGTTLTGILVAGAGQTGRLLNVDGLPTGMGHTNLLQRSAQFDNAYWNVAGATITADAVLAPDGTTTADLLTESAADVEHRVFRNSVTIANSTTYTLSVYARAHGRAFLNLLCQDTTLTTRTTISLADGSYITSDPLNVVDAGVVPAAHGFVRAFVTWTSSSSSGLAANLYFQAQDALTSNHHYLGDGVSGLYLWGAQFETGTLSDYIPTTSAPVTAYPTLISSGSACSIIVSGRSYLYVITDDVVANTGGTAQLGLDCLLRAAPADNATVEFAAPIIEGWLTSPDDWTIDRLVATSFDLSIAEAA